MITLVFRHEEDGGDGRWHIIDGTGTCPCGNKHEQTSGGIDLEDLQLGYQAPELFCQSARKVLVDHYIAKESADAGS